MADYQGDSRFEETGFASTMGWGKRPVLLVIDVCKAYWTDGSPLDLRAHSPSAAVPDVIRRLVAAARDAGTPVIWTAVECSTMIDAGLFWYKSKALDVWQTGDKRVYSEWLEGLEPTEGSDTTTGELIIRKKYPSAFFSTTLATDLTVLGADTVVLCGVSTSGCVRASTLDCMQHGFRPMTLLTGKVVGTACGDRSDAIQTSNLFDLNAKYADIVSESDAIDRLSRKWE